MEETIKAEETEEKIKIAGAISIHDVRPGDYIEFRGTFYRPYIRGFIKKVNRKSLILGIQYPDKLYHAKFQKWDFRTETRILRDDLIYDIIEQ